MLVIGLTGGIGSGKSTVAKLFAERGVTIIDTDHLAREVTQKDQPALKHISAKFGHDILLPDGALNRSALRKIIFNNENYRIWLEQLLHPLIRAQMQQTITTAKPPYCIVVIPLLLETQPNPLINRILVVDATEDHQIKRTQTRDSSTPADVKAILKTQVSRDQRLTAADDIIENNGTLTDLIPQVEKLHLFYTHLAEKQFAPKS